MHFLFNSLSIFMTAILNSLSGKFISPFHWGQFLESYLIPSGLISLFLIFFPCFLIFLDSLRWCLCIRQNYHLFQFSWTRFGFPGGSDGKASALNEGALGSIPGSGRSPGEGNGNPLQYSCLENSMDRGAL